MDPYVDNAEIMEAWNSGPEGPAPQCQAVDFVNHVETIDPSGSRNLNQAVLRDLLNAKLESQAADRFMTRSQPPSWKDSCVR